MKNKFLKPNNLLLTKVSKKIQAAQIPLKETQEIINTMLKVTLREQKEKAKPVMVGLAAPQIGILKRIILVDVKADGKGPLRREARSEAGKVGDLRVYINPEIIWSSKRKGGWYEGCFSTGKVCGIVSRPTIIKIKAIYLTHGMCKVVKQKYSGYVARIFQHEIDHLDGIRFPDLITNPANLHWVKKSEFPLYRNNQVWKNWPKKCSFEKWNRIKNLVLDQQLAPRIV